MSDELLAFRTWPWLATAHRVELFRSSTMPPVELTSSTFVLLRDRDDRLLLTYVDEPGRGWDVPGGHLDPGEDAATAAVRELAEEAGYVLEPAVIDLAGWYRVTLEATPPQGYRYRWPTSYMVAFTARIDEAAPDTRPMNGSECTMAEWCDLAEASHRCPGSDWLLLATPRTVRS